MLQTHLYKYVHSVTTHKWTYILMHACKHTHTTHACVYTHTTNLKEEAYTINHTPHVYNNSKDNIIYYTGKQFTVVYKHWILQKFSQQYIIIIIKHLLPWQQAIQNSVGIKGSHYLQLLLHTLVTSLYCHSLKCNTSLQSRGVRNT